jgi:hypothetical protein
MPKNWKARLLQFGYAALGSGGTYVISQSWILAVGAYLVSLVIAVTFPVFSDLVARERLRKNLDFIDYLGGGKKVSTTRLQRVKDKMLNVFILRVAPESSEKESPKRKKTPIRKPKEASRKSPRRKK